MSFSKKLSDEKFKQKFIHIISKSRKDNTYKFALARFLLDYSNTNTKHHVSFSTIAEYFLKYYWVQECKSKLRQAPQESKRPDILNIINNQFGDRYYPQEFDKIKKQKSEKIQYCIDEITRKCFHNVIWRFQRIQYGRIFKEEKIFFDFKILRKINDNKKDIDLEYGIYLNPHAITFLKKYNVVLSKAVILEWSKFLEDWNIGVPKIITKTEGTLNKKKAYGNFVKI